jgi:hypothetical protein
MAMRMFYPAVPAPRRAAGPASRHAGTGSLVQTGRIGHRTDVGGRSRDAALALFAVTALVGAAATVATLITGNLPENADSWPNGPIAVALGLTGLLIRWQRPRHACGWSLQIAGLLSVTGFAANWWAAQTLVRDPGALPGGGFAAWVALWVYPLAVWFGFAWPVVLFPRGRRAHPAGGRSASSPRS